MQSNINEDDYMQQSKDYVNNKLSKGLNRRVSQFEQLHLKYSYSGMSNASSVGQFGMTTMRSFNQDFVNKLQFVEAEKLYETICKMANDLQKLMLIHKDLILYVLYQNKWNQQRLNDFYFEQSNVDEYKQMNQIIQQNQIQILNQQIGQCQICQTDNCDLIGSYFCQHLYCKECWISYLKQNLLQNKIFFTCMDYQCKTYPILLHFVKKISPEVAELYRKKICVNYAIVNKSVSYCPSDNCSYFCQKPMTIQQNYIQCPCGTIYCFRCQRQPHQPATCQQVQKWEQLTNQQKNNQKWMNKYTRKCPSCKNSIEKYVGCNHIKCYCGAQFCFNCNKQWDQRHKTAPDECLSKHSSIKQDEQVNVKSQQLQKLTDKIIYISRSMNRDMKIIKQTQTQLMKQQSLYHLKQMFQDLRLKVHHSWINLKWSLVSLYLREKQPIEIQLQKDSIYSIQNLIESVTKINQKIKNYSHLYLFVTLDSKELNSLKEELKNKQEKMNKAITVWTQAWKGLAGQAFISY